LNIRNTLLVSSTRSNTRANVNREWRRLIAPGLTVTDHKGSHLRMMRQPQVWSLAQTVEAWLSR
jgi:thioesterase domain-containing protein